MGEGEPQGERNTSPHACVHEARKCMPSHTDRLIPRPLPIQALPTDTLGEDWDVLREPSSLGGGQGGTHSSWFLPLPSQDYFSNPIPQRPWEGGKEEGAMPLFGSLEGQKSGGKPWLMDLPSLNCLLPLVRSHMGIRTLQTPPSASLGLLYVISHSTSAEPVPD